MRLSGIVLAFACLAVGSLQAEISADSGPFDAAVQAAGELPRLHSLLVSRNGELVLERYFHGRRATSPANVKSVAKSIISALVGIAADRKLLDLDHPIRAACGRSATSVRSPTSTR